MVGLFKKDLMQLFVSLVPQNVRLDCEGISPHEVVVSSVKMRYDMEIFAPMTMN